VGSATTFDTIPFVYSNIYILIQYYYQFGFDTATVKEVYSAVLLWCVMLLG
jgi:hypothetical protein